MHAGLAVIGLILIIVGALYLTPMFGMKLIPFTLPTMGYPAMYVGGGALLLGIILLIIGIKWM